MGDNIEDMREYIASLDLWVISHGGVGSEALVKYMEHHTDIKAGSKLYFPNWHGSLRHFAEPWFGHTMWRIKGQPKRSEREPPTPILLVMGDIWNSLVSQHRRNSLSRFGMRFCQHSSAWLIEHFPDDPVGIKSMFNTYTHSAMENVVIVKAPFTKQSVVTALQQLNFTDAETQMAGFQIMQRSKVTPVNSTAELTQMYAPYIEFQRMLDEKPAVFSQ